MQNVLFSLYLRSRVYLRWSADGRAFAVYWKLHFVRGASAKNAWIRGTSKNISRRTVPRESFRPATLFFGARLLFRYVKQQQQHKQHAHRWTWA